MKIIRIKGPQGSGKTRLAKVIVGEYKNPLWLRAEDVSAFQFTPKGFDLVVVDEATNLLEVVGGLVFRSEAQHGDDAPDFLIVTQQ